MLPNTLIDERLRTVGELIEQRLVTPARELLDEAIYCVKLTVGQRVQAASLYLKLDNPDISFTLLQPIRDLDRRSFAIDELLLKIALYRKEYQQAGILIDAMLEDSPHNLVALEGAYYIAVRSKQVGAAKDYLSRLLLLSPNEPSYLLERANIFLETVPRISRGDLAPETRGIAPNCRLVRR